MSLIILWLFRYVRFLVRQLGLEGNGDNGADDFQFRLEVALSSREASLLVDFAKSGEKEHALIDLDRVLEGMFTVVTKMGKDGKVEPTRFSAKALDDSLPRPEELLRYMSL